MKKGKTSKIQSINCAKAVYGTVDSVSLKSIYLNIQTWVEPTQECENWTRTVLNMSRAIKHVVYESIDRNILEEKFIVDLDLRSSGIAVGKKSFMNLEINFYLVKDDVDFKSKELRDLFKKITNNIYDAIFYENEYFNFYLTKKGKTEKPSPQLENV